jgi:hypothetical protein
VRVRGVAGERVIPDVWRPGATPREPWTPALWWDTASRRSGGVVRGLGFMRCLGGVAPASCADPEWLAIEP